MLNAQKGERSHCPLPCEIETTVLQTAEALSLFGLSGRALEYFPPSQATECHKGTSVADKTEVATVFFRESQGVSQTFFHASFFSFNPLPGF